MRALVIEKQGEPVASHVVLRDDMPDPVPGAGEVLIATEASGLNHLDLWVGRGVPGHTMTYPAISGSDGCGRIIEAGDGVDTGWLGKRVIINAACQEDGHADEGSALPPIRMIGEHSPGTMAEKFLAPVCNCLDVGESDPSSAAAFGLAYLTAWRMLVTRASLASGQWVLIPGIGGGVALACLGIAVHHGAQVIVTSRHASKLERARALGAAHVILDEGQDFSSEVRVLTGKRGVDICAESIGKVVHMSLLKSLCRGGILVTCGCTSGADAVTDLGRIFWNQLRIEGSTMGSMDEFRAVTDLFLSGSLCPEIDSTWSCADGAAAYARLESGEHCGKVIIDWQDGDG